jgi:hypothetical protein
MRKVLVCLLPAVFFARAAHAHHGVASVGLSEPEGPGAALDTTAALPLPRKLGFALVKTELVPFQTRRDRAAFPEQKTFSSFNTMALGLGLLPYLSAYLFQPYNIKSVDGGIGSNAGLGDPNLMLAFGFKWDEGLRLIPQKESLDELADWHFLLWASCTLPLGPTEHNDDRGNRFDPDMQTGFGSPSPAVGLAVLRQLSTDFTALAEINYQYFIPHQYSFTRYQFGGETRLGVASVYRAYAKPRRRVDLVAEAVGLNLQRDREESASNPDLSALCASGGQILYGGVGIRVYVGAIAFGLGIKRALVKNLNEADEQQGSEGLETLRLSFSVSAVTPL